MKQQETNHRLPALDYLDLANQQFKGCWNDLDTLSRRPLHQLQTLLMRDDICYSVAYSYERHTKRRAIRFFVGHYDHEAGDFGPAFTAMFHEGEDPRLLHALYAQLCETAMLAMVARRIELFWKAMKTTNTPTPR